MRLLRSIWFPILIGLVICMIIVTDIFWGGSPSSIVQSAHRPFREDELWQAPDVNDIPSDATGDRIRYGRELVVNTARYLGPEGIVRQISNGTNCQNCHLDAGTRNFANPFSAVSSTYPKFRHRSGKVESIEFRVNECMQRSLNGEPLDSLSEEMRAFVAYLEWISQGVPKDHTPKGASTGDLAWLNRAADPVRGKAIFTTQCQRCHGSNGEGIRSPQGGYQYPPLWGENSYNTSAGLYRLSRAAGFIKHNMPLDKPAGTYLSDEDAWDVAAFIAAQPRPEKTFVYDWPDISRKPPDFPFGPFADPFPAQQHKYGPFPPIVSFYKK
ncbi:MAG TPA: c-type cytochrome [Flavisolibacter sp.]